MKREVVEIETSGDGKRTIYVDYENFNTILSFFRKDSAHQKKLRHALDLLLNHYNHLNREFYEKECIQEGCEHVYALKPFKGGKENARIYCQHLRSENDTAQFAVVFSELIENKKSTKITNKLRQTILKVASYEYDV